MDDFSHVLSTKNLRIEEDVDDAIDLNSICETPKLFNGSVRSGDDIFQGGQIVLTSGEVSNEGKLVLAAIEEVELLTGFNAEEGSEVRITTNTCPAILGSVNAYNSN